MQILKGEIQKSVTIRHLLNDTRNSRCYVYYEQPLQFESAFINSNYHSLNDVIDYLEEDIKLDEENNLNITYDYFILYTNNTEDELKKVIEWLDKNSHKLRARIVLITCR